MIKTLMKDQQYYIEDPLIGVKYNELGDNYKLTL